MFVEYPVWVISVAVLVAVVKRRLFLLVFIVLYDGRSFISLYRSTEFWNLSSDYCQHGYIKAQTNSV